VLGAHRQTPRAGAGQTIGSAKAGRLGEGYALLPYVLGPKRCVRQGGLCITGCSQTPHAAGSGAVQAQLP